MHFFKKSLTLVACLILSVASAYAQAVRFEVAPATSIGGIALFDVPGLAAGTPTKVKVSVLDENAQPVVSVTKDVTISFKADYGQQTDLIIPAASFVNGVADEIDITPDYSATSRFELDNNGLPYAAGARVSATDGNIVTDNASKIIDPLTKAELDNGFFSVAPASFTVTYSGGNTSLSRNKISDGKNYLARVTALNNDGSVASGYRGSVTLTSASANLILGTAVITFGGIADRVSIGTDQPEAGVSIDADDGVTSTVGASATFDITPSGGGASLTVSNLGFRSGGTRTGENTTLVYRLTNPDSTNPVTGPIDTNFRLVTSNNALILQWSEETQVGDLDKSANTGDRVTNFTIPFDLPPGTYTIQVQPGYGARNQGTISLTLANNPDLAITQFNYVPGQYNGGDALRIDLTWKNLLLLGNAGSQTTSALDNNNSHAYMIEVHLSTNATYGDGDDFLVWQESFVGNGNNVLLNGMLLPDQQVDISRYIKLPENLAGTYYLLARINSAGGVNGTGITDENVPSAITFGNNTVQPRESQKITLLPKQATNTFRVSLTNGNAQANALSDNAAITRDGQFVVFESLAQLDNGAVAANTTNIYIRNVEGGSTALVSTGSGATGANGNSGNPEVTADGRYVVFQSSANNLVPADTNGVNDIFIRDVQQNITRRLTVNPLTGFQANNGSQLPSISADGRFVVFESSATNLTSDVVPTGITQIYLYDRDADGNGILDQTGPGATSIQLISTSNGVAGTFNSTHPRMSADGNFVSFITRDTNILGQSAPFAQVVRWDRVAKLFITVTRSLITPSDLGDNDSGFPAINADGSFIAFASRAQNLTSDTYTSGVPHVFRAQLVSGAVTAVLRMNSRSNPLVQSEPDNVLNSTVFAPDLGSFEPTISDDGTLVAFASESVDLLPPIPVKDIDRSTFQTRFVYHYFDTNMAADVYLYNLSDSANPVINRASVSRFGYEATAWTTQTNLVNLHVPVSRRPVISGDGRYVAFTSDAKGHSGLIFGATNYDYTATNDARDIYIFDRKAGLPTTTDLPQVAMLPAGISTVTAGQTLTFVANASSSVRAIASVEFYANNFLIGTDTTPSAENVNRYSVEWVAPSPGAGNTNVTPYQISAIAVDSNGLRSTLSNAVDISVKQVSGVVPSVIVTNPVAITTGTNTSTVNFPINSSIPLFARVTNGSSSIDPVELVKFYAVSAVNGTTLLGTASALDSGSYGMNFVNVLQRGSYSLVAVATDSGGNVVQSPAIAFNVTPAVPGSLPFGNLIFPATGSVQTLGQPVPLQALASDVDGAIASVAFYANGVLVGTDSTAPFTGSWTPTVAGAYSLVLLVTDAQGATTVTAPVTVTVNQSTAPIVSLVSPVVPTTIAVGSNLPLEATASDSDGTIASVGFYADGALVATGVQVGNSTTYTATWTPTVARSGAYKLTVKAIDNVGQVTETSPGINVTVTLAAGSSPTVQVTSPASGGGTTPSTASASLASQVFFAANAVDNIAVTSVRFYADGIPLGSATQQGSTNRWVLTKSLNGAPFNAKGVGNYSITALASDSDGNQTQSAPVTLSVTPLIAGSAPTVTTIFPVNGQRLTLGASLNLQVLAADSEGAIASVATYANGVLVGTTTSAPFTLTWTPSLSGFYNIVYVVTDDQGSSTVTSPVTVTVVSAVGNVPVASMLFPNTSNNSFTNASTIPLAVSVLDSDQPVATAPTIAFYVDGVGIPALPVRLGNSQGYYIEYATNLLPVGAHTAVALVTDAAGNLVSNSTNFTITQASGPSFTSKPSLTANGATAITVTAGDTFGYQLEANKPNGRLTQMEIFLNGVSTPSTATTTNLSQNPVTAAPFISTWYAGQFMGKSGTFALATDNQGNVMVSNLVEITRLDNGEPTVTVISPISTSTLTFGQPIVMDIEAKATTAGDIIKSVIFLANSTKVSDTSVSRLAGTDIWRLTFLPSVPSTYAMTAVVTTRGTSSVDPATGTPFERSKTSSVATFVVNPVSGISPSISLIAPTSTTTTTGGTTTVNPFTTTANSKILLVARAVAGGSPISQVEFFARSARGGVSALGLADANANTNTYQRNADPLPVGSYDIFAVVTDLAGNRVQSAAGTVSVTFSPSGTPPVGSLAFPFSGSVQTLGQTLSMQALASDADGAIASVNFYVNGVLIDTDTTTPFNGIWTPTQTGLYKVSLMITDAQGVSTVTDPVPVTVVKTIPPVVSLAAPSPLSVRVGQSTLLRANATPGAGTRIAQVQFLANGTLIGTDVDAPYSINYLGTTAEDVLIVAVATDTAGNTTISSPQTLSVTAAVPPLVALGTLPSSTLTLGQTSVLSATAVADSGLSVTQVEFRVNGNIIGVDATAPYSFSFTPSAVGDYIIEAVATDSLGNVSVSGSRTLNVVSATGLAPTVTVQAPAALTTSSSYAFRATASDADGVVSSVEFFLNGVSIGQGSYNSSSANWVSPVVSFVSRSAGTYTISAVAIDNSNNHTSSAGVDFTVSTSTTTTVFGSQLNAIFYAALGRNATDAEQTTYFNQLGANATDYEITALLMQSSAFDSLGASVINAYLAVFGKYPGFADYQNGLFVVNSGTSIAGYIDFLYGTNEYISQYGVLPTFIKQSDRDAFALRVHANLTNTVPSARSGKLVLTASALDLSAEQLAAAVKNQTTERALVFSNFTLLAAGPTAAGTTVANYITSLSGTSQSPSALLSRARVVGVILALTETADNASFSEADGLRKYYLLDIGELYATGKTDAAIKPVFRTLPTSTSVQIGSELKFTAVVISPASVASDINAKWRLKSRTVITSGTGVSSLSPVHTFTYTVPAASAANASSYDFTVSNRYGTTTSAAFTATISPATPNTLPGVITIAKGSAYSVDLGGDFAGMRYVATGIPAGLRLNPLTGVISGTPIRSGRFTLNYYTILGKLRSSTYTVTYVIE